MTPSPEAVHDALDRRFDGEYHVKRTLSEGDSAVRLLVEDGHEEIESMIEADYHQKRWVPEQAYEVLFESGEGITETILRAE